MAIFDNFRFKYLFSDVANNNLTSKGMKLFINCNFESLKWLELGNLSIIIEVEI